MLGAFQAQLQDYAAIKIGVIAVGSFSSKSSQLDYLRALQQRRRQTISDLHYSRSGSNKNKPQEEARRVLQLNFCATTLSERRRRVEGGGGGKTWENFQAHRSVFGVIGFCDGSQNANVIKTYERWNADVSRRFPATAVTQFHIITPTVEQEDEEGLTVALADTEGEPDAVAVTHEEPDGVGLELVLGEGEGEVLLLALTEGLNVPLPEPLSLGLGDALPEAEGDTEALLVTVTEEVAEGDAEPVMEAEPEGDALAHALDVGLTVEVALTLPQLLGEEDTEGLLLPEKDGEGLADGLGLEEPEPDTEGEADVEKVTLPVAETEPLVEAE